MKKENNVERNEPQSTPELLRGEILTTRGNLFTQYSNIIDTIH